jgi:hypothetical protein
VAAGGVAERHHRGQVEAVHAGEGVDPGRDVVEGGGRAAAASGSGRADPAVLQVERRPPVPHQGGRERPAEGEVVLRLPEAAVDDHDDAARRTGRERELTELAGVVAVGDPSVGPSVGHLRLPRLLRRSVSAGRQETQAGEEHDVPPARLHGPMMAAVRG